MSRRRGGVAHRFEFAAYRLLSGLFGLLPEPLALRLGASLGSAARFLLPGRRRLVLRNLEGAFPDATPEWRGRVCRDAYRHFGREAAAMLLLGRLPPGSIDARVELDGEECIREALAEGKGVIVVSGHLGNWEVGAAALAARGYPVDGVAQGQANPWIDRELTEARARLGVGVIPRGDAARAGLRTLRAGRVLGLVADQNARGAGVIVPFLGVPASTHRGPALLSRRSGAPILLVTCLSLPGGRARYRLVLRPVHWSRTEDPEEEIRRITAAFTRDLGALVGSFPGQYFWHHRRWRGEKLPEPGGPGAV